MHGHLFIISIVHFVLLSSCYRAVFILIMDEMNVSGLSDYSEQNNTISSTSSFGDEFENSGLEIHENSDDFLDFLDEPSACEATQRNGAKRVGKKLNSKYMCESLHGKFIYHSVQIFRKKYFTTLMDVFFFIIRCECKKTSNFKGRRRCRK